MLPALAGTSSCELISVAWQVVGFRDKDSQRHATTFCYNWNITGKKKAYFDKGSAKALIVDRQAKDGPLMLVEGGQLNKNCARQPEGIVGYNPCLQLQHFAHLWFQIWDGLGISQHWRKLTSYVSKTEYAYL